MKSDVLLYCFGLLCPMAIRKTSEKIKLMKIGKVLEVLSTDEGIKSDMPAWCKATGNEFLGVTQDKGEFKAYVRKLI